MRRQQPVTCRRRRRGSRKFAKGRRRAISREKQRPTVPARGSGGGCRQNRRAAQERTVKGGVGLRCRRLCACACASPRQCLLPCLDGGEGALNFCDVASAFLQLRRSLRIYCAVACYCLFHVLLWQIHKCLRVNAIIVQQGPNHKIFICET